MVEVFSLTSRKIMWTPGRTCWRISVVMMTVLPKKVVSHRWKVLLATQASKMRQRQSIARSPLRPLRCWGTTSFCPNSRSTFVGVRASAPNMKRGKQATMWAMLLLFVGLLKR